VERLLADGKEVVIIDDLSTGNLANLKSVSGNEKLQLLNSKVSEVKSLTDLIEGCESVYHLAAAVGVELVVKSPIHVLQTNLHETEVLLEACARSRRPMLFTSTSEVYGKSAKEVFKEDDDLLIGAPNHSRWSYACSKLMDEFLALAYEKEHRLPVVIVRLFNTVGPRQTGRYGMVLPRFIASAQANAPVEVYGDGRQSRCFCYVKDTVEALVRLQNCPTAKGQVVNIGSTEEITILDLAKEVIETLESKSQVKFVSYSDAYEPGFEDMRRRQPAVLKLQNLISFSPSTPLTEIISSTAAWYSKNSGAR
jgi:UDP-glucose 4-epimerase